MKKVSVNLDMDIYDVLRRAKDNRNVTISSVIRKALREYITKYPHIIDKCVETKRIRVCN